MGALVFPVRRSRAVGAAAYNTDSRIYIQGQSNAHGRALRTDLGAAPLVTSDPPLSSVYDANPFNRVWIFNAGEYQPLEMGVNQRSNATGNFGPEFGIAVRWMRETLDAHLFIDKHADGGQPITYFQEGTPGGIYSTVQSDRTAADAWLSTNGYAPTDCGLLWVQGESDVGVSQATYFNALTDIFSDRIADSLQISGSKRLIVQMYPGTLYYDSAIAAAKVQYVSENAGTSQILDMANYFNLDGYHLSARGQVQLGYDAYSAFFSAPALEA